LVLVGSRHNISLILKYEKALGVKDNEILAGFLYLTDLEEVPTKAKRKIKILLPNLNKSSVILSVY